MWHATYHAFPSRAAFLAACDAAGWMRGPDQRPLFPEGVVLDEVGPIMSRPTVDVDGTPVPGEVLDARYHVNAAWLGNEPPVSFQAMAVIPSTPQRTFCLPLPVPPQAPTVPAVIPAWKGLAWLEQAGKLNAAEAAAQAGGPIARHAWARSAEWPRHSPLMLALAAGLGLSDAEIDAAFIVADGIGGG